MKKFLLSLTLLFVTIAANAAIVGAPFIPEEDTRFDAIEQGNTIKQTYPAGSADGHYVKQYVKATYDFAKKGGAIGSIDLGVSIPANAVETRSWVYDITQPTTSAAGTLAFYCASSASPDLKQPTAAASYPAAGAVAEGTQTGTAANFSVVSSKCNINAKIGTGALTAGKVVLFVEYAVHQ